MTTHRPLYAFAPIFALVACLAAACGGRSGESETQYETLPNQFSGLMAHVHDGSIAVCMAAHYTSDHKAKTKAAVLAWLAPLRAIDPKVTQGVVFSCPGHIRINVGVDTGSLRSHTLTGAYPVMNLAPADVKTRYPELITHEMGHAFGMGDTYVEKTFACKPGQPPSVMCNGNSTALQSDDKRGIVAKFHEVWGGSPQTVATASQGATQPSSSPWRMGFGLKAVGQGLQVSSVPQGSKAGKVGFEVGDVIVAVNGQSMRSIRDYDRVIASAGSSALFKVTTRRGTSTFRIHTSGKVEKVRTGTALVAMADERDAIE